MQDNRKVLCLFDYKCHTGWASTSTNIIQQLKNHYGKKIQFDIIAINYFGEPIIESDGTYIISAVKSATKIDKHGRMGFLKILKESNDYDAIFIMEDLGVITPMIPVIKFIRDEKIKNNKKIFKSIFYTCVDCNITNDFTSGLDFFTSVFAYTEYTSKQLLNLNPKLLNSLQIINSGININEFYVLDNNEIQYGLSAAHSNDHIDYEIMRNFIDKHFFQAIISSQTTITHPIYCKFRFSNSANSKDASTFHGDIYNHNQNLKLKRIQSLEPQENK